MFAFLFLTAGAFAQNLFSDKKGQYLFDFSSSVISYERIFFEKSEVVQLAQRINSMSLELYGEYGLRDDFVLLAKVPMKIYWVGKEVSKRSPTFPSFTIDPGYFSAFGNIEVGLRRKLLNKNGVALSLHLSAQLPTAAMDINRGLSSGYGASAIISSLSITKSYDRFFASVLLSSFIRNNLYSDGLQFWTLLGFRPLKKLWVNLELDLLSSFENGDLILPVQQYLTGTYLNDQSYLNCGAKLKYELRSVLQLYMGFHTTIRGNYVARSPSIKLGVLLNY